MKWVSQRLVRDVKVYAVANREKWPIAAAVAFCILVYVFSISRDSGVHIYKSEKSPDFKDARILGFQGDSIYEGKEKLLAKTMHDLKETQTALKESQDKLQVKMDALEKGRGGAPDPALSPSPGSMGSDGRPGSSQLLPNDPKNLLAKDLIRTSPGPNLSVTTGATGANGAIDPIGAGGSAERYNATPHHASTNRRSSPGKAGMSIISFPVKDALIEKVEGIVLPSGSYVKAKLMTGIEAPEGKTFPVLLQLDYAYIIPNHNKLDLSGCFMIAKSQGDLSTERVQMQATKLSCVSKQGKMFERDVNGFIADDKDNSFAVIGSVNSKQDRVAAMGFLSLIVEGVGKAIQLAQTTQQAMPLGGTQSIMTGNQLEYLGAGGAASAAGMVTQWYLKQAQNLLPTINIGSGQNIWVVMQDTVKLPNDYFRKNTKGDANDTVYTYFSRIVDGE